MIYNNGLLEKSLFIGTKDVSGTKIQPNTHHLKPEISSVATNSLGVKKYIGKISSRVGEYAQKAGETLAREAKLWTYEVPKTLIREHLGVPEEMSVPEFLYKNKVKLAVGGALIAGGLALASLFAYKFEPVSSINGGSYQLTFNPTLHPFSGIVKAKEFFEPVDVVRQSTLKHIPYYLVLGELISFGVGAIYGKGKKWRQKS